MLAVCLPIILSDMRSVFTSKNERWHGLLWTTLYSEHSQLQALTKIQHSEFCLYVVSQKYQTATFNMAYLTNS